MTSSEAPALTLDSASPSFIRLHVTPFDPDLSKVILSSSIHPHARNICYHSIDTFPEKRYGFVDLPKEDADKLRKKLNGAVLKGVKIRIEPARASSIPEPLGQEATMGGEKSSKRKESYESGDKTKQKKRKRDNDEIPGVVLEGRKVKRGWTTTDEPSRDKDKKKKDKKDKGDKKDRKQAKSKYTDHEECLVKTILPANVASTTAEDGGVKKRKKKGTQREVVVHEFEKTTKFPTFLRDSATSSGPAPDSLEYVEGKGWTDAEGTVVQPVKPKRDEAYRIKSSKKSKKAEEPPTEEVKEGSESVSDDSSDESDNDGAAVEHDTEVSPDKQSSEELETSTKSLSKSLQLPGATSVPISPGPGSAKSLTIKIPPATPNKVHPLEALYKKPKQADGETSQEAKGFSFFGNTDNGEIEDETAAPGSSQLVPMTPFTREDIELRGIRSAAPTPDTAHPGRRFKPWVHEDDDIEEEEAEEDEGGEEEGTQADGANVATGQATGQAIGAGIDESTSDFQKWFWENRGDLNRSWKKRRKLAGKEKRYRENKARLARAI